jgi:hypothetical protein
LQRLLDAEADHDTDPPVGDWAVGMLKYLKGLSSQSFWRKLGLINAYVVSWPIVSFLYLLSTLLLAVQPKLSVVHKLPKNDTNKKSSKIRLYMILGACYVIAAFAMGVCLLKLL